MSQHLSTFGTAYEQDDSLLIPVAFVAGGGVGATSNSLFTSAFKQVGADTKNEVALRLLTLTLRHHAANITVGNPLKSPVRGGTSVTSDLRHQQSTTSQITCNCALLMTSPLQGQFAGAGIQGPHPRHGEWVIQSFFTPSSASLCQERSTI